MLEFFEDGSRFYLIFEKVSGGPLLAQIQSKGRFNENEASQVIRDVAM
jgi:MAP kinase interacting serine/threonine kinase